MSTADGGNIKDGIKNSMIINHHLSIDRPTESNCNNMNMVAKPPEILVQPNGNNDNEPDHIFIKY